MKKVLATEKEFRILALLLKEGKKHIKYTSKNEKDCRRLLKLLKLYSRIVSRDFEDYTKKVFLKIEPYAVYLDYFLVNHDLCDIFYTYGFECHQNIHFKENYYYYRQGFYTYVEPKKYDKNKSRQKAFMRGL